MDSLAVKKIIKSGEVVHSRALVDACYSLSRDQKRLIWLFLIDAEGKDAGIEIDNEHGVMEFSLKAYSTFYGIDAHEASRDVVQALKDFSQKEVVFYLDDESTENEQATDTMAWLAKKSYRPKRGRYVVYFNPYLVPFLKQITDTVSPKFQELDKLQNPKHIRLYTKLLESNEDREVIIDVAWMLQRFELPGTYERYSNFKQRFLLSAVNEIKKLKGMENLEYSEKKTGRKVTSIHFIWG